MQVITNTPKYTKEITELLNSFLQTTSTLKSGIVLHSYEVLENGTVKNSYQLKQQEQVIINYEKLTLKNQQQNLSTSKIIQLGLYEMLSKHTGVNLPWGALFGIRPVKLAKKLLNEGLNSASLIRTLKETYFVSSKKANLVNEIIENQTKTPKNNNLINLYINIPFCTSRCSYCSFASCVLKENDHKLETYVNVLLEEIAHAKQIIKQKNLIVKSVYIGGGTPSILSVKQLEKLLNQLNFNINEFTLEAGRADTLTKEKLTLIKNLGVTRISLNPQSFNEKTLKAVNRPFNITKFIELYSHALSLGLIVNCDLIAGLKYETLKSFKSGVDTLLEMHPHNITVHSLSLKTKSSLKNNTQLLNNSLTNKMLDYAYEKLGSEDYYPYYLYRQKNIAGALENVGFSLKGFNCNYNIDTINESTSTLACGMSAVSKKIDLVENSIKRYANYKNFDHYTNNLENIKKEKGNLFD